MTQNLLPVFVNGRPLQAVPGASLAQLLGAQDPDLLVLLLGGASAADARGLPIDPDAPVYAGGIYRVQRSARTREATDA